MNSNDLIMIISDWINTSNILKNHLTVNKDGYLYNRLSNRAIGIIYGDKVHVGTNWFANPSDIAISAANPEFFQLLHRILIQSLNEYYESIV